MPGHQDESPSGGPSTDSSIKKLSFTPNRDLLDSEFEGYKLNLEPVPVYSSDLSTYDDLLPRVLSEAQISFAHAKLALVYNANIIVRNPYSEGVYILGRNSILSINDRSQDHRNPEVSLVWSQNVEETSSNSLDIYNPSLVFADEALAVHGNGLGTLNFLSLSNNWKSEFKEEICGSNRSFVVLDAVRVSSELQVLVMYVDQSENVSSSLTKEKSISVVEWMSFEGDGSTWNLDRVRRYAFYGPLEKCQLIKDGKKFYFVTDKPFKIVFDSTLGEDLSCPQQETEEIPIPTNEEITPAPFHWHQTVEDMSLWCLLPKGTTKRDIKVDFKPSFLCISVKGEPMVSGKLWNILESDTMSWTIKDRKLELNFSKVNEGMIWQRFLADGPLDGDELADPNAIDLIQNVLASREEQESMGTSFNMNELEDVDSAPDSNQYLYVLSGDSHKTLGKGDLGGRQWLFNGQGDASFCLRHDVDGLVWELSEEEDLTHVATFSAIGYVQASKTGRKYTVFPPNHSYVAIIDSSRHVYLYRQPSEINSELRNRKSGNRVKAISKQSVITLEDTEEIIGAYASNQSIIICTPKRLICIKVL